MFASKPKAEPDGYVPFLERFSAWWHGADSLDQQEDSVEVASTTTITVSAEPKLHWPDQRRAICERLWGEGIVLAGGLDAMEDFIKPLCLNSSMSVLDLTAGLGGGAAAISKKSNIWITALESDPELATHAAQFCTRKGASKVAVTSWQPASPKLPAKKYDCIYARESFYLIEDKQALLTALFEALKPGGQLLFSDYVLAADTEERAPLTTWRRVEPGDPRPWDISAYRAALKKCDFKIRICNDETESQRRSILAGWSAFVEGLHRSDLTRDFVDHMMHEAELWLARMRAFEDGQLQVARIHALKPSKIA
ncbi:MAG: methyltransferase domain-containing protein [Alphaproteobacteria bacterium]